MKITNRNNIAVFVCKEPYEKNDWPFAVNPEAACEAIETLSEDAWNLWCYLAKGRSMVLSLDNIVKRGFKESSFYEAMDELTKVGYVSDLGEDAFIFYEFLMDDNEDAEAAT